jgi:hypothetical protein
VLKRMPPVVVLRVRSVLDNVVQVVAGRLWKCCWMWTLQEAAVARSTDLADWSCLGSAPCTYGCPVQLFVVLCLWVAQCAGYVQHVTL